jgi:methanogenic corrinoid protein MtbC1
VPKAGDEGIGAQGGEQVEGPEAGTEDGMNEFSRLEKWLAKKKSNTATLYKQGAVFVCALMWETKHECQDVAFSGENMATAIRKALDDVKATA